MSGSIFEKSITIGYYSQLPRLFRIPYEPHSVPFSRRKARIISVMVRLSTSLSAAVRGRSLRQISPISTGRRQTAAEKPEIDGLTVTAHATAVRL
jgi:hypothetical protein